MKTLLLVLFISIGIFSCIQQDVINENNDNALLVDRTKIISSNPTSATKLTVDFNYSLKTDPSCTNCWACPTPKSDCSKISKSTATNRGIWAQFQEAMGNGTQADFFSKSNKWNSIFPIFRDQTAWLEQLQSGKVVLVRAGEDPKSDEETLLAIAPGTKLESYDDKNRPAFALKYIGHVTIIK